MRASLAFIFLLLISCVTSPVLGDFTLLGTHPDAALQPTEAGRTLHTLEAVGENLFIGFGDYSDDTGPISIRGFNTNTATFSEPLGIGNTEAVFQIRDIGDRVFALSTDPLLMGPGGYLAGSATADSPWEATESLSGVHFYGITEYQANPQRLFLAGSGGETARANAMVYQSMDGGANWTTSLDLAKPDGLTGVNFLRIYGIAELNNSLYVQPIGLGTAKEALNLYVYDGNEWQARPTPKTSDGTTTEFFDAETFADHMILRNNHSGFRLSPTFIFDGEILEEITIEGTEGRLSFWDQFATQDTVFLLTNERTVVASSDLAHWRTVAREIPSTARSLAVIGDQLYFGTLESTIYQGQLVSVPEPSAASLMIAAILLFRIVPKRS